MYRSTYTKKRGPQNKKRLSLSEGKTILVTVKTVTFVRSYVRTVQLQTFDVGLCATSPRSSALGWYFYESVFTVESSLRWSFVERFVSTKSLQVSLAAAANFGLLDAVHPAHRLNGADPEEVLNPRPLACLATGCPPRGAASMESGGPLHRPRKRPEDWKFLRRSVD